MIADVDTERLAVLGQIAIMRNRLDELEKALIRRPVGYSYMDDEFDDAQGNLSFQTGMLIGRISRYKDLLR